MCPCARAKVQDLSGYREYDSMSIVSIVASTDLHSAVRSTRGTKGRVTSAVVGSLGRWVVEKRLIVGDCWRFFLASKRKRKFSKEQEMEEGRRWERGGWCLPRVRVFCLGRSDVHRMSQIRWKGRFNRKKEEGAVTRGKRKGESEKSERHTSPGSFISKSWAQEAHWDTHHNHNASHYKRCIDFSLF